MLETQSIDCLFCQPNLKTAYGRNFVWEQAWSGVGHWTDSIIYFSGNVSTPVLDAATQSLRS